MLKTCRKKRKSNVSELKSILVEREDEIAALQAQLAVEDEEEMLRRGKTYPPSMRISIYTLLEHNCATEAIPYIYKDLGGDFGKDMTDVPVPSKTTVERMATETGVISDILAAQFMYTTEGLTLAFDATTQEGVHINVISVQKRKYQPCSVSRGTTWWHSARLFWSC